MYAQSRQSAKLFLQSSELAPPAPSPAGECAPPPPTGSGGRAILAGERGVWRVPIPTRGQWDIHCGTLYIYVLCGCTLKGLVTLRTCFWLLPIIAIVTWHGKGVKMSRVYTVHTVLQLQDSIDDWHKSDIGKHAGPYRRILLLLYSCWHLSHFCRFFLSVHC
jgi:hypothetical protein